MVSIKPVYSVDINVNKTNSRIKDVMDKGLEELHRDMLNDSNIYIKVVSGKMRDSGYYNKDGFGWGAPYAGIQYNNDNVSKHNINPKATGHWFEKAKSVYLKKWIDRLQEVINK